jgi:hypothetical protein
MHRIERFQLGASLESLNRDAPEMTASPSQSGKDVGADSLSISTHSNSAINSSPKPKATSPGIGHFNSGGRTDEFDYGHHQMLFLSPELDAAVGNILGVRNPLDTNMLSVVEYMNKVFPSGKVYRAHFHDAFAVEDSLIQCDVIE